MDTSPSRTHVRKRPELNSSPLKSAKPVLRPSSQAQIRPASPTRPRSPTKMNGNVKVAVRARPLLAKEKDMSPLIEMKGQQTTILPDPASTRQQEPKTFAFDESFWSVTPGSNYASQSDVYEKFGVESLDHSLEGYNACILAYGQTGSGKSHTMMGTDADPGIIPRICKDLFGRIKDAEGKSTVTVRMSFCEIYNEQVRDLLSQDPSANKLKVRDSADQGAYVEGLSEFKINSVDQVVKNLEQGMKVRATASTNMNSQSSRSHAVFSLRIKQIALDVNGTTEERCSLLRLVDLAGSERADATGATGDRLREGSNINKSLVTLGRVISSLADSTSSRKLVPYRDSILTRLLQDSLGGNSKTAMIACLSPISYQQSLSTLRYADQAKKITLQARVNQEVLSSADADARIEEMQRELNSLQQALAQKDADSSDIAKITATVRFYEDQAAVLETKCKALAAQNKAVMRHNELVTDYLREVTNKGMVRAETTKGFDDIENQHSSLLNTIDTCRSDARNRVNFWQELIERY